MGKTLLEFVGLLHPAKCVEIKHLNVDDERPALRASDEQTPDVRNSSQPVSRSDWEAKLSLDVMQRIVY